MNVSCSEKYVHPDCASMLTHNPCILVHMDGGCRNEGSSFAAVVIRTFNGRQTDELKGVLRRRREEASRRIKLHPNDERWLEELNFDINQCHVVAYSYTLLGGNYSSFVTESIAMETAVDVCAELLERAREAHGRARRATASGSSASGPAAISTAFQTSQNWLIT